MTGLLSCLKRVFLTILKSTPQTPIGVIEKTREMLKIIAPYERMKSFASIYRLSIAFSGLDEGSLRSTIIKLMNAKADVAVRVLGKVGETEFSTRYVKGFTYLVRFIKDGSVKEVFSAHRGIKIIGSWLEQTVLSAIGACMIYVAANASIFERRREVFTISSLGATPSKITALLVYEGLTFWNFRGNPILCYWLRYSMGFS